MLAGFSMKILPIALTLTLAFAEAAGAAKIGFAVLELFTSEGCSSCPPAEEIFGKIAEEAQKLHKPIHLLAFHVDYWNQLGWVDPFSNADFTARQRLYATAFGSSQIYTPQLVINGEKEIIGSEESRIRKALDKALAKPSAISLGLRINKAGPASVELEYELSKVPENVVLNAAVVERELVSNVTRGENSGLTLRHTNVVRLFHVLPNPTATGLIKLNPANAVKLKNSSVIVYLQDAATLKILAAAALDF